MNLLEHWFLPAVLVAIGAVALFVAGLPWLIQPFLRLLLWPRYRLELHGREHIPTSGPVVLASNHVTWLDGFFVAATCPRRGRALVNAGFLQLPIIRFLAVRSGMIPVPFHGPRAVRAAIEAAGASLDEGKVMVLFPEGQLTRNGMLGPFYRGLEVILKGRENVPVVPVYLDNLWGSLLSYSEGRFLKKRLRGWRRTVVVVYGPPVLAPFLIFTLRQAVLATGVRAAELRTVPIPLPEPIDPALPHLDHPVYGMLTGSAANFDRDGIKQTGTKPGTVGHPLPGVALRVVDESGATLPPDVEGRVQALVPGLPDWADIGARGALDRDGFLTLAAS